MTGSRGFTSTDRVQSLVNETGDLGKSSNFCINQINKMVTDCIHGSDSLKCVAFLFRRGGRLLPILVFVVWIAMPKL